MREIKFSPTIQLNDIKHKSRNIDKLLSENEYVKLTIAFTTLEAKHPETGQKVLDNVLSSIKSPYKIHQSVSMEGKNMQMVICYDRKKR